MKDDGGPAFPSVTIEELDDPTFYLPVKVYHPGMSLRDYLAMTYTPPETDVMTMCEIMFTQMPAGSAEWPMWHKREARARLRYNEADAMLKERKQGEEESK